LDSQSEIEARIRAGEDNFVEFKEVRLGKRSVVSPNAESFAGELVAFANAEGGAVFLGVSDDGRVQGLPEPRLATIERWVVEKPAASSETGVVAAQNGQAAEVGAQALRAGGNAVDAAVAKAFALAVL